MNHETIGHERPEYASPADDEVLQDDLPDIQVTGRQLPAVYTDAWHALLRQNVPPVLFVTSGRLTRPTLSGQSWVIERVSEDALNGMIVRAANWLQLRGGVVVAGRPPREVARDFLANPTPGLPELTAIGTAPEFDAGGQLLDRSGYHPEAALVLKLDAALEGIRVPARPTPGDLAAVRQLLLGEILVDFQFKSASDRAHALAAMVLPFVRRMVDGPTPIHLIEAPGPGVGKSLLGNLISIVVTGRMASTTTLTTNETDTRKKLTALLKSGARVILIDNVRGGIRSAELAAATTSTVWSDRNLGTSDMIDAQNRCLWLVTGTNLNLSPEIARRCLRIRLIPDSERPWNRGGFRHPHITAWAMEHRPQLVEAVLVAIQSWIAAGRPQGTGVLGSFEAWSRVVGGIVGHLGEPEFLGGLEEFYAEADQETRELEAFVAAWWAKYQGAELRSRDLQQLAAELGLMAAALEGKSAESRDSRFGKALRALRDRKISGFEIVSEMSRTRAYTHRLRPASSKSALEAKGSA